MALKTWPKPFQYFNDVKVFLISVSIVVTLFLAAVFLFRYLSINKLLLQSMRQQAATYADLIVLTRHWNARYGGVYDEAQARLTQMAITDELTGLRNRRFIIEQLEEEYQRAVRSREPLSLILLDIDHFKRINDTYGHAFGDVVLRTVAEEMKNSLRRYDILGRIGGEEFLIASPGSARDDDAGLADRILEKIRREKIGNGPQTASVTLSAGVTMLNRNDGGAESLFSRADAALYKAKQEGRDRVVAL